MDNTELQWKVEHLAVGRKAICMFIEMSYQQFFGKDEATKQNMKI